MSLNRMRLECQLIAGLEHNSREAIGLVARDLIDADANTLCRLEGSRNAAAFAFHLSDRMVGKMLGQPTEAPIYLPPIPAEMSRIATARPVHKLSGFIPGYLAGVIIGLLVGFTAGRMI